jgi:exonuclease III
MDMRFGTWNVRSLYRAGSLMTVSRELARYKLDSVGVQEVRWEGGSTEPAGEYTFLYGMGNKNHELGTGFLCIRESYQQLRGLSLLVIGCHTYY